MAFGNRIVVQPDPRGHYEWGYVTGTPKPGTILQIDGTVARSNGKNTWVVYNRDADGNRPAGPFAVLVEDLHFGRDADTAITSGDFCKMYIPLPGDELNLLFGNASGTADDVAVGGLLIVDDGTGKVVPTTGSPETEIAVALEAIVDPTADQLLHCRWTGY